MSNPNRPRPGGNFARALPYAVAGSLLLTGCNGDKAENSPVISTIAPASTIPSSAGIIPGSPGYPIPKPAGHRDIGNQKVFEAEAWSETNRKPLLSVEGKKMVEVDGRAIGDPAAMVGVYDVPAQIKDDAITKVQNGDIYPALCYKNQEGPVKNKAPEVYDDYNNGNSVWVKIDIGVGRGIEATPAQPGTAWIPHASLGFVALQPGDPNGLPPC